MSEFNYFIILDTPEIVLLTDSNISGKKERDIAGVKNRHRFGF